MKQRISFIEFLNSVPLGWGFLNGSCRDQFDLLLDVPSRCARRLAEGEAEVGLIPVIEYQNIPGLTVIPDISIASKQEVKSVLFVSRKRVQEVKSVALDTSSRTSAALLKILMALKFGKHDLQYAPHPPKLDAMLSDFDAALVIGNPALNVGGPDLFVLDLAREWNELTGLPFVFAFWAVRPGVDLEGKEVLFRRSKEEGLRHIKDISKIYSQRLNLPSREIEDYLRFNLDYSLDGANLRGLGKFYRLARDLDLIPSIRPIEFYRGPIPSQEEDLARQNRP